MGSTSSTCDSLNGLKFGQKIYFEDVGVGAPAKSGGGSSFASGSGGPSAAAPAKKVKGVVPGGLPQPPRCQVEGCEVDLSDAKAYYSRHKVCGMHSKSPKVIVAGIEQRFCQQCSRFHQLPEFDQGKRSCRRRLAGHNERRRKPPPGSLFPSRYGRLPSSAFENGCRSGGFLVDFSAQSRLPGRDTWPSARSSERPPGNQATAAEKYLLPYPWQSSSENAPSDLFMHGSASGTRYPSPGIPPGECFTGVSDSGCALSLLSNQPWGSRTQALGLGMNSFIDAEGIPTSIAQPTASHAVVANHLPNTAWVFKGNEMPPGLGVGHISPPINNEFSGVLGRESGRHYMELEHSRAYDSTQQMHWSL